MALVPIVAGGGKLNYKHRSYVMSVFIVDPPFTRVFANKHPNAVRSGGWSEGDRYDPVRGGMFHNNLLLQEGAIVMVQMSASTHGVRQADAAVFYSIREQAPLVRVSGNVVVPAGFVPPASTSLFFGHADRLTLVDLYARGVQPSRSFVSAHMYVEEIAELLVVEEVAAASTPKPQVVTVENSEGKAVTITAPAVVRRMRIRRNVS